MGRPSEGEVGVELLKVRPGQAHVQLVYTDRDGHSRRLHLGWHLQLRDEPWRKSGRPSLAAVPRLSKDEYASVGYWLRRILKAYPGAQAATGDIPYGFGTPEDAVSSEGSLTEEAQTAGLTCATFVLAVFHRAEVVLLDYETWRPAPTDEAWQRGIIDALQGEADDAHLQRLRASLGAVRFRPSEVYAAATLVPPLKQRFSDVEPVAKTARQRLGMAG